jgi:hypothetical protein
VIHALPFDLLVLHCAERNHLASKPLPRVQKPFFVHLKIRQQTPVRIHKKSSSMRINPL